MVGNAITGINTACDPYPTATPVPEPECTEISYTYTGTAQENNEADAKNSACIAARQAGSGAPSCDSSKYNTIEGCFDQTATDTGGGIWFGTSKWIRRCVCK